MGYERTRGGEASRDNITVIKYLMETRPVVLVTLRVSNLFHPPLPELLESGRAGDPLCATLNISFSQLTPASQLFSQNSDRIYYILLFSF